MKFAKLSARDEAAAYDAAQAVVETHRRLARFLEVGQTLDRIDQFVALTLSRLRCRSCFLGYKVNGTPPFPSHACLSVNHCVVHGTHDYYKKPIKSGDVVKIDIGVYRDGWVGDAAWTYVFGEPTEEVRRLCEVGKESLRRGIAELQPGQPLINWARTVQDYVEGECGLHLVRGLGGHGYGRKLHAPPHVANTVPTTAAEWPDAHTTCAPGMLLALEPMIAIGTSQAAQSRGAWPVFIADGSQSVHYEHDVLITADGPRVLTEGLDDLPDVIG